MGIARRKRAGRNALKRVKKNRVSPAIFKDAIVQKELRPLLDKIETTNPVAKYRAVGLTMEVNTMIEPEPTPLLLSDPPPERKRGAGMSLNEARYLQKLVEKHGNDVAAMARDHKSNYDQKSPGQLKKRLAIYRSIYGEEKEAIPVFLEQPRGRLPFRYIDPRVVTRTWGRRKPPRAERYTADVVSRLSPQPQQQ